MPKPAPGTYPVYFERYIAQVKEDDLLQAFTNQQTLIEDFLRSISEEKSLYAYAAGKWTLREMLQHIIDTERIFCYRALCFARGDKASLPGFEEDAYAANSFANNRSWQSLSEEFRTVRRATIQLFSSFDPSVMEWLGTANNNPFSVLGIGFAAIGHFIHHDAIVKERYS